MQRSTERAIKAYLAFKFSPVIVALIFLAVTFLTVVVPVVAIGCYQRYVVKGVPFPH